MVKFPYRATMRPNLTETFDVNWMIANDDAKNLPYATMFGSSRFDCPDKLDCHKTGEIYVLQEPYSSRKVPAWLKGEHVCGTEEQWLNGWAPDSGTLPVAEDGIPLCCGEAPAAFSLGFDLGFDS